MSLSVYDPQGKWFKLNSPFPFHDTISGVVFQPGEVTKATPTENTKGNPRLEEVEDPTAAAGGAKKPAAAKTAKAE